MVMRVTVTAAATAGLRYNRACCRCYRRAVAVPAATAIAVLHSRRRRRLAMTAAATIVVMNRSDRRGRCVMTATAAGVMRRSLNRACCRRLLAVAVPATAAIAVLHGRRRGPVVTGVVRMRVAAAAAAILFRRHMVSNGGSGAVVLRALPAAAGAALALRL
jgi:hypothetical protein